MTEQEYETIGRQIVATFPELGEWFKSLPDEASREAQRARRRAALVQHDLRDVESAVIELRVLPELPWQRFGQQGNAFSMVAAKAQEFASKRREKMNTRQLVDEAKPLSVGSYVAPFRKLAEELVGLRQQETWTRQHEDDWFAEQLGPEEIDNKRHWVSCKLCGDTGIVTCLSTIKWVKPWRGIGEPRIVATTMSAACTCHRGDVYGNRKQAPLPRYNADVFVKLRMPCSGPQAAEQLAHWKRTTAEAKRITGFDDFNRRADEAAGNEFV